jgi:hypothetical protein
MKDGVTLKISGEYNLEQLSDRMVDKYKFDSNDIGKVFKLSNLPLFGIVSDMSGKRVFINMDNVLYIEEIEQ